jgi:hypothetical protein
VTVDRHRGTAPTIVSDALLVSFSDLLLELQILELRLGGGLPLALSGGRLKVEASPTAGALFDVSDRAARLLGRITAPGAGDIADLATIAARLPAALVGGRLSVDVGANVAQDVTDRAARLLGVVASITAAVDVSDRAARVLGTVSPVAASTWDVSDRAARLLGIVKQTPATLSQVLAPAANTGGTMTLAAAGAGLFHYITHLSIRRAATALLAGGALLAVTTTNLGGRTWRTGNQASITVDTADGMLLVDADFASPIRSDVANTASTIVLPAPGAAVSWTAIVDYYTGP